MTSESPDWLPLLRMHTERFGDVARDAELDAPVPSCPGWSLRDLVVHLGGVHQWATHAVVEGNPNLRPEPPADEGRSGLTAWYRRHASHLVDVLTSTATDAPAWTLDDRDPTAQFWMRRQVHETVMHAWDAENALGQPRPMDPSPRLGWSPRSSGRDLPTAGETRARSASVTCRPHGWYGRLRRTPSSATATATASRSCCTTGRRHFCGCCGIARILTSTCPTHKRAGSCQVP